VNRHVTFFTKAAKGLACLVVFFFLIAPMHFAYAEDDVAEDDAVESSEKNRRTLGQYPKNVLRGMTGLFDKENVRPFLWGAAATGLAYLVDDDVRERIENEDDKTSKATEDLFGAAATMLVLSGVYVVTRNSTNTVNRAASYDVGVAVVSNFIVTNALKLAVGRTRPNEGNDKSFPSGHSSNAFAIAAVVDSHYGRRVGVPAYVVASLVGLSRVRRDAHWFSDVVAGATIGYLSGKSVVRQNNIFGRNMTITPSLSSKFQGIVLQGKF
jgi:hypothetical protein